MSILNTFIVLCTNVHTDFVPDNVASCPGLPTPSTIENQLAQFFHGCEMKTGVGRSGYEASTAYVCHTF